MIICSSFWIIGRLWFHTCTGTGRDINSGYVTNINTLLQVPWLLNRTRKETRRKLVEGNCHNFGCRAKGIFNSWELIPEKHIKHFINHLCWALKFLVTYLLNIAKYTVLFNHFQFHFTTYHLHDEDLDPHTKFYHTSVWVSVWQLLDHSSNKTLLPHLCRHKDNCFSLDRSEHFNKHLAQPYQVQMKVLHVLSDTHLLAWCQPPYQLIATSAMPMIRHLAAIRLAPQV